MKTNRLIILVLVLLASCSAAKSDFDWLVGSWERTNGKPGTQTIENNVVKGAFGYAGVVTGLQRSFNSGFNFSIDTYDGIKLKRKLSADNIKWKKKDSLFKLFNWKDRKVFAKNDEISSGKTLDTTFTFTPKDFNYQNIMAQEMGSPELIEFIDISKKRGIKNLNAYLVELYKRTSLPIACYILTLIAVALAYRKKRGGTGMNLALGISIMFIYVFLMKITEVLGAVATVNSFVYVWMPNIIFGCLAVYLYLNARK